MSIPPGPWAAVERVDTGMWNVRVPAMEPDGWIATCGCRGSGVDVAHLMAAAPDMKQALEDLLWYVGQLEIVVYSPDDTADHEIVEKAKSAIAKAEGRS